MTSNLTDQTSPVSESSQSISSVLGKIPSGVYVLTAQHEDRRMGMLTSWVQQVGFQPPMICVAIAKGRPVMPLVSESSRFALCQLSEENKIMRRKFAGPGDLSDDPFLGYDVIHGTIPNLPILKASLTFMECQVACHMDVEGDHDIFIAQVVNAQVLREGEPEVRLRENGFEY